MDNSGNGEETELEESVCAEERLVMMSRNENGKMRNKK